MQKYEVTRKGICITCGQSSVIYLGEYEAETEQEAIDKAIGCYYYDNFGGGVTIRQKDITEENNFLAGEFKATLINKE